jgi:hypothetical protein
MKLSLLLIVVVLGSGCGATQSVPLVTYPFEPGVGTLDPLRGGFPDHPRRNAVVPISVGDAENRDWPGDPARSESVCASVSECRTTAQGLGV